ncbi:MAG: formate dehydrogenase subunit alpha, partial [Pseudomonadota bacterium]|nr:formate dehydrogenase subunit alpha [Pseudomonadota bacterium]
MNTVKQLDLGTEESKSKEKISIEIDGQPLEVKNGTSIMRAARESGIDVPKLCATDSLKSFGSCRLCVVEIEGRKGFPASCTTLAEEGMKIRTQTNKVAKLRRNVMELYISDHPLDCLTCSANGDCELQDMAGAVGLRDVRYGFEGKNHLEAVVDESNPYFNFDASKCIVCSRCVRACDEIQGTMALTIEGRGFDSKVSASIGESFLDSECVSCGACVQACPTATLMEKSIIDHGQPEHSVDTTCAYCGVGCSFKAEMKGDQVVRMVPNKDGKANNGHSCVKGRFAWGYSTHKERVLDPLIRENIGDPWKKVNWEEAINYTAKRFKEIQNKYGRKSIGGITSSRCTAEEVFVVQKMVRTAFSNNNVDTCARVCHSPTGYGLKTTLGTSAGTQPFESVMDTDVMVVIGANPTDGHPVFASQMKKRLRQGAKLIVIDPRKIDLVKTPHIKAAHHLPLQPGTNVPIINALAHTIIKENLMDEEYINERCDMESFEAWKECILKSENDPDNVEKISGVNADTIRSAARLYGSAKRGAIYYGLGVTEHSQGSTMVMGMANLAMATGNIGFSGCGVNPLRGQNNVQGSCDMGSFPHELPGYQPVGDDSIRKIFEDNWQVAIDPEPGFRIPNMFDAAISGEFMGMYIQGEDLAQSDPNTQHVEAALGNMECIVVQDLFLNETAKFAHVFLPGTSFLEKNGTFINAERRINRVRPVMKPQQGMHEWLITQNLANAMGYDMNFSSEADIMNEIARLTPTFRNVSHDFL